MGGTGGRKISSRGKNDGPTAVRSDPSIFSSSNRSEDGNSNTSSNHGTNRKRKTHNTASEKTRLDEQTRLEKTGGILMGTSWCPLGEKESGSRGGRGSSGRGNSSDRRNGESDSISEKSLTA